ncbi:hypothetical protein GCM10011506_34110 [Marivirga lumbricoides]|uniref:HNH nuclease domain-containing protein n=1 Tax=Marivirga lumbricoides TaxID=1046115 RepID=A0ABQ1MW08_9BACT|nr:hypothetical protein GCM10011506_34110 [Marivirga lumbricoides]
MSYFLNEDLTSLEWFQMLEPNDKLLYLFIQHELSFEGIWVINTHMTGLKLGIKIDLDSFLSAVNKDKQRVIKVDEGRKLFFTEWLKQQHYPKAYKCILNASAGVGASYVKNFRKYPETDSWLQNEQREGRVTIVNDPIYNIEKTKAASIKKRDNYTCGYCHNTFEESKLEIDHIKPVFAGGDNNSYNLISACGECNKRKSNKDPLEFIESNGIKPEGRLIENLKYLVHHKYIAGALANSFTTLYGGFGKGEERVSVTSKDTKVRDKGEGKEKDKVKGNLSSTTKDSAIKKNKSPSPLEYPEDLKAFLKLYGKHSSHKDLVPLWSALKPEERNLAFLVVKKLKDDGAFMGKDPFYFLRDKDYDGPPENEQEFSHAEIVHRVTTKGDKFDNYRQSSKDENGKQMYKRKSKIEIG